MTRAREPSPDADGVSVLSTIEHVDTNQWNNLVSQSDLGTLFHRAEWLAALEDGLSHDPAHVIVTTDTNPVAVLPNFITPLSLPYGPLDAVATVAGASVMESSDPGFGGPIVASDEAENLELLFDALDEAAGRSVLYRHITTYDLANIRYGSYLESRGYEPTTTNALFVIDLGVGWESIRNGMDKERTKALRRAHEQDYRVEVDPVGTDLARTYMMYARNMARVDGVVYPRSLFRALADHVAERVRVFTAHVDDEVVGKYIHLLDRESGTLHHWLSAIPDRSCYDAYPSELLHAQAIQWGIDHGYDEYSFERADAHFENSIFRFKTKYGGEVVPLLRWEHGENSVFWPLFKFGRTWDWSRRYRV